MDLRAIENKDTETIHIMHNVLCSRCYITQPSRLRFTPAWFIDRVVIWE